ncbi:MAG: hypothetical protein ACR5K2_00225 [Wolbachia sp.]
MSKISKRDNNTKQNVTACPTKERGKVPGTSVVKFCFKSYGESINFNTRRSNANVNSVNEKPSLIIRKKISLPVSKGSF